MKQGPAFDVEHSRQKIDTISDNGEKVILDLSQDLNTSHHPTKSTFVQKK